MKCKWGIWFLVANANTHLPRPNASPRRREEKIMETATPTNHTYLPIGIVANLYTHCWHGMGRRNAPRGETRRRRKEPAGHFSKAQPGTPERPCCAEVVNCDAEYPVTHTSRWTTTAAAAVVGHHWMQRYDEAKQETTTINSCAIFCTLACRFIVMESHFHFTATAE